MRKKITVARCYNYYYYLKLSVIRIFSTAYCRFFFRFLGVRLKRGSTFYGVPLVYLFPGSVINIENNVRIRTSRISNFIGLNRRSTISTHSQTAEIIIGNNCAFSAIVIGARESIRIGNDVMVGANVLITDFDWHSMRPDERQHGVPASRPIVIADNVFIGYSATILKGVSIGENSVIGANSVVTKDIPANVIAAGNPCRVIKAIT
jgi:acetyltransferase-like isoleucine patch superfamily enzyme